MLKLNHIYEGDAIKILRDLPDNCIDCCVTSPPYYGLRNYGHSDQIGLEKTPELYVSKMVEVFGKVKRVLKPEGTLWLNLGDSYAGSGKGAATHPGTNENWKQGTNKGTHDKTIHTFKSDNYKPKDLIGIPWAVAFALRSAGWYLRSDIIWHKPNPMPESVTDRPTKSHEYIFLMSKSQKYYYDYEAIQENGITIENRPSGVVREREYNYNSKRNNNPDAYKSNNHKNLQDKGQQPHTLHKNRLNPDNEEVYPVRNKRSVWTVTTKPYKGAHFATFPQELIIDCIKAGCPPGGIVLDPFSGANTTGITARKLGRNYISIELNPKYIALSKAREEKELGLLI